MVHDGMQPLRIRVKRASTTSRYGLIGAVLLLAWPLTAPADETPLTPVRIAVHDRASMALLRWADERGDFAAESLTASFSTAEPDTLDALAGGTIDVMAAGAHTLMQANQTGYRLRGMLVLAYATGTEALVGAPEVRDVSNLRGGRVGIVADSSVSWSEVLLAYALQQRGLSESRVTLSYLDEADAAAWNTSGLDAIVAGYPTLASLGQAASDGHSLRLADASREPGLLADLLLADETWLRRNKETAKRLIRVWDRVVRAQRRDPAAAATAIARHLDTRPAIAAEALNGLRLFDTNDNLEVLRGEYQQAFSRMSIVLEKRSQGRDRRVASANRLLDLAPLRQVARGR